MSEAARWLLVAALVAGCAYWLAATVGGLLTMRRVPCLDEAPPGEGDLPALSVVSPACDEAPTLEAATRDRLRSDYPGLEFVLVDDRSHDGTGELADRLAAQDPRLRVLHVRELPEGWLGKVHAQEAGWRASRGEWVLFMDADVHLAPDALRRAVAMARARGLDHLAVMPHLLPGPSLLDATIAVFGRLFMLGTRPWALEDPQSSAHIGVGAFNLVRRSALERLGGLAGLRLAVADDVELGRLLKLSGARQGAAVARRAVWLRWYESLPAMARGLEKNLFAYAGRCQAWRLVLVAALVLFLEASTALAWLLPHGQGWLSVAGLVLLAISFPGTALGLRWNGRHVGPGLLWPLGSLAMTWIMLRAAVLGARRGGVLWRGTLYPSALLREAMARAPGWPPPVRRA